MGVVIILAVTVMALFTSNLKYGLLGAIVLSVAIAAMLFYFYANSLNKILLEKDNIVLKKNIGQIKILKADILEVNRLEYSNLPMTHGSNGVFGFIGNTMDNSFSLVKDRKSMIQITTKNKTYILRSENADDLVREIRTLINSL